MRRSISIIIPAYNEEKRLPDTLTALQAYLAATSWEFTEIVVVDDGSRDGTAEVARAAGVHVLQNPGNRGKGYSVRHGMLKAQGDWLLFSDADLSTPIAELDKLWAAVERERAQAAIGSRDLDRSLIGVRQPLFREFGGRFFNLVIRLLTRMTFLSSRNLPYGRPSQGGCLPTGALYPPSGRCQSPFRMISRSCRAFDDPEQVEPGPSCCSVRGCAHARPSRA